MPIDPKMTEIKLKQKINELLAQKRDLVKEINKAGDDPGVQRALAMEVQQNIAVVQGYKDAGDALDALIKKRTALHNAAATGSKAKAAHEKEIKRFVELKKYITGHAKDMEKATALSDKQREALVKVMTTMPKYSARLKEAQKANKGFTKTMLDSARGGTVFGVAKTIGEGMVTGFTTLFENLTAEMVGLSMVMRGISWGAFKAEMAAMANTYDQGFRGIMKKGFTFQEDMEQVFAASLDPLAAPKLFGEGRAKRMLTDMGLKAGETSRAFIALKENAMFFTADNITQNKAFTAEVTNLYAGLSKLGVGFDDSAKAFDVFTKSLKQAPMEALKSTKRLVKIASSLDITVGKAFRDFNKLMPNLAQYGDQAIEVFSKLEAQSRATGIEVGSLAKLAEGFDTFKGAAKAAQGLNAVLGGTFISMTDLVSADPAEKINIIRQAFARAGLDFATAHRRVKQVVASLIGKDVQTATRLFGSEEDYDKITSGLDTTAASAKDLKEKLLKQMTSAEHLKRGLQSLYGGMQKLVKISRTVAKEASTALTNTFIGITSKVKGTDQAVIALMGTLKVLAGIGKVRNKLALASGAAAILGSLSEEDRKKVYEKAADEGKQIIDMSLDSIKALIKAVGIDLTKAKGPPTHTAVELAKARVEGKGPGDTQVAALTTALTNFTNQMKKTPIIVESNLSLDGTEISSITRSAIIDFIKKAIT
tara:strand:- start:980 stop:3100 length:2121 start_codon:yes stop_codon:yes gene_type:complete